ncbi:hypothetical protein GCM10010172_59180 [Paractinoplanes ferrugineus]|uniref:Uncharacterized protein n=1 Tax=Paractinoplanes ferrugineus TaxID=113564 RepID=A0A919J3Z6_9ACTN|nr:hypothetical protein [Actinoplanes ferrugineus]GIE14381.1 hypothetical protein Afe05nite_62210 [Actinoplanes ferrugineus]
MADVSPGEADGPRVAAPAGATEPDESGAVGVGTGGPPHAQGDSGDPVVRIGLAFSDTPVDREPVGAGVGAAGAGVRPTSPVRGGTGTLGARPGPIPALGGRTLVTAGRGGNVSAAAGVSVSSDPSPLTTPR